MKKNLTLFLPALFICLFGAATAQTGFMAAPDAAACGTEQMDTLAAAAQPHYGNNAFLTRLADSVEAAGCNGIMPWLRTSAKT